LQDWRGIPAGSIRDIVDAFAKLDLIPRGIVKAVEVKAVKAAPNKMIKKARNK